MPKDGFKGQWIQICRRGDFVDASGKQVKIDDTFLDSVIATFNAMNHEPPIVIGHPETDAPAYGWTKELRRDGDFLEARFADTNNEFEQMVEQGSFKKRSAKFYTQPPILRHVGFLGAVPPAVKGLKNIQFNDNAGESVTVEFSLSKEQKMEEKDMDQVADSIWEKIKNKFKTEPPVTTSEQAAFSEDDKKNLIAEAVKQATEQASATFAEEIKKRDEIIEALKTSVDTTSASGKRSEIVSFVETIPASRKHYLKNVGVVEFMETLANDDAVDTEKAICFSEGDGDKKVEHKFSRLDWVKQLLTDLPPSVQFGEKFGDITVTEEFQEMEGKNPERVKSMKAKMGISNEDGGEK